MGTGGRRSITAGAAVVVALAALVAGTVTAHGTAATGLENSGPVTDTVLVRPATGEAEAIVLAPPSAQAAASALSASDALRSYQSANPDFRAPPDLNAQLGLYTAEPRYDQVLAWAYSSTDTCVLAPNPEGGKLCAYWLLLDARTGAMLESIILP